MIIVGIEFKLEEKERKYFEKNGGKLLVKKLDKINRKLKDEERLKIYSTQTLDSISTFVREFDKIKCYSTVKFYYGKNDKVVVQTIEGGVPQDRREDFVKELVFLSERHENFVRVLGCCLATHEPVIVYELRDNDNIPLSVCTSSSDHATKFTSEKRLKAAKGVARGLKDLYKFNPTFVREDISSANIVINTTSYEAKIFYAAGSNLISTAPADNEKSAVYSFGKVLVELLTGGRPGGTDLSNSIRMAQDNSLLNILHDEMKGQGTEVAMLAQKCLNEKPEERPTMKKVLAELLDHPTERTSGSSRRSRS